MNFNKAYERFSDVQGHHDESVFWDAELKRSGLELPPYDSVSVGQDTPPSREMQMLGTKNINGVEVDLYYYPHDRQIYVLKRKIKQ